MKTEKERMLKALVLVNDVQTLIKDNQFEKYLQDHLIVVEYELQRQLSLINADERRRIQIGNPEYAAHPEYHGKQMPWYLIGGQHEVPVCDIQDVQGSEEDI